MSNLEKLLDSIHPTKTIDQISARANLALESFSHYKCNFKNIEDFFKFTAEFYHFMQQKVLRMTPAKMPDPKTYTGLIHRILVKELGPNGVITAMEICLSGIEGGIFRILKIIANNMIENYTNSEITAKVIKYWETLTIKERLKVADEYLKKYSELLPYEYKVANAARLRKNILNVLIEHPRIINRIRRGISR